jgi:predicted metal-dependent phosphotriesterase family hydrolase
VPEGHVVSVTGPRRADELGAGDAHDHLFLDSPALAGQAFQHTGRAIAEVLEGKARGIGTVVEMTPIGLGRRP